MLALFGAWGARTLAVTASYNLAVEMHELVQNQELSSEIMMFSDSQWRLVLLQRLVYFDSHFLNLQSHEERLIYGKLGYTMTELERTKL